jgi:hypothetical protein
MGKIYRLKIEAVWYEDVEAESEEEAFELYTGDAWDNYEDTITVDKVFDNEYKEGVYE